MRRRALLPLLGLALTAFPASAQDGAKVFNMRCKSCHGAVSTPMGPALSRVAGAKIAGRADFKYSTALKAKTGIWDAGALDAFLTAPGKYAPGTKMMVGVPQPADRAAVIAYLATLK